MPPERADYRESRSRSSSEASSSSSASARPVDLNPDEEWADAESDEEHLEYHSLFDDKVFSKLDDLLAHSKSTYGFDMKETVRSLELDFYGCIKIINYLRSLHRDGQPINANPSIADFEDDKYMKPVLEDDALLMSIDEIIEEACSAQPNGDSADARKSDATLKRVQELEEELARLNSQFAEYRLATEQTLEQRWSDRGPSKSIPEESSSQHKPRDDDTHYFDSYSYNDIHETMLKDTTRTSAYRDFIYNHKHLFAGKTVLDIGCGTGILSLFCARAGAARVIAVDNSAIVSKAAEIVAANNLSNIITCVRGKIEDVTLPLNPGEKVDVIVSEWMGYMLLYEAMLDSVLWARDRYLDPQHGLMVPSHCTLRIAPVADPDFVAENVVFWREVYGFDMEAMMERIYDDVLVRSLPEGSCAGQSAVFKRLPLHTVKKEDLSFKESFEVQLAENVDALDGWLVWFDTFFATARDAAVGEDAKAESWGGKYGEEGIAFTTGPGGPTTHWQAGLLVIDWGKGKMGKKREEGTKYKGTVEYKKREENSRELEVCVEWSVEGDESEQGKKQMWFMR